MGQSDGFFGICWPLVVFARCHDDFEPRNNVDSMMGLLLPFWHHLHLSPLSLCLGFFQACEMRCLQEVASVFPLSSRWLKPRLRKELLELFQVSSCYHQTMDISYIANFVHISLHRDACDNTAKHDKYLPGTPNTKSAGRCKQLHTVRERSAE